jgi:high-affinity iron transporter
VQCCNPILKSDTGGWSVFYALFGWTNSATYGSVISYNVYWLAVIVWFLSMLYFERTGHWPLIKGKPSSDSDASPVDPEDGVISKGVDSTAAPFTIELTIDS